MWAQLARNLVIRPEFSGKNLVTVFPDTGERYLSWFNQDDSAIDSASNEE